MISRLFSALLVSVLFAPPVVAASRLTNVSVRSTAGAEADTLIVGFTISGSGNKSVLIRGIGPTLGSFGVAGAVADPELRLFNRAGVTISENNNWGGVEAIADASTAVGAFALPAASQDAAILVPLAAGTYSAHLTTRADAGIALVEAYDTDGASSSSQITNLSARSVSAAGAGVLTVGFAIAGDVPKVVLIRATGPALTAFGVGGALVDPQLRLFSARGLDLGQNDDWVATAGWGAAFTAVGAFPLASNSRDAAMLVRLSPGAYTAQASGANGATGVALIEVYDVPQPPVTSAVLQPVENAVPANFPSAGTGPDRLVTTAVVLTQARPTYPFDWRRAGITGEALIQFVAGVDGRVSNAFVVRATDIQFANSALAAVRQWTFRPGINASGQPAPTIFQVPILFTLN